MIGASFVRSVVGSEHPVGRVQRWGLVKILCHACAISSGHLSSTGLPLPAGSTYQHDKHVKHTEVGATYSLVSVFSSPSTRDFDDFLIQASLQGAVEFDNAGRKNIIWCAGRETGFQYQYGKLVRPVDAVKVVLTTDPARIHAFPESSTAFSTGPCAECGGPTLS